MKKPMLIVPCITAALLLGGCGMAETASVAATEAEAAAQQIKEGEKLKQNVQDDIDAIQKAAADARQSAETAAE